MTNGEIATIVNTEFQIRLFHDFIRRRVHANVVPDWRSGIAKARSRTEHLVGKLQALNRGSNRVLFVRLSDNVSNKPLFGTRLTPRQATEWLLMALRSRFDRMSLDLMCVSFEQTLAIPDPSLIYVDMSDPADLLDPKEGWKGTDSLWDEAFNAVGARLEPPKGLRPSGS